MKPRVAVAAIFKNELPYVLEWVAYYRHLGTDAIIIGDNVSSDGTSELLEALELAGFIRRLHFPRTGDHGPQAPCYNRIIQEFGADFDLIAFLDADEFLVSTRGHNPLERLRRLQASRPDLGAVAINWRIFGSGGQRHHAPGLVLERFYRCSEREHERNHHIKTVLDPRRVKRMNIHECVLRKGRYYTPAGTPAEFAGDSPVSALTRHVEDSEMVVNHYVVKSLQENMSRKRDKGSAAGDASRRKGHAYFQAHDLNHTQWHPSATLLDGVRREILHIRETLWRATPYYHYGKGIANVAGDRVSGWAVSDFPGELWVSLLVNGVHERVVRVQVERPDVVRKGLSQDPVCGFQAALPEPVADAEALVARIYGSGIALKVRA